MIFINGLRVRVGNEFVNGAKTPLPPIPSNTVRVRTKDGNAPNSTWATYETATLVPGTTDVYDVYKSGTSFEELFKGSQNVIEVLGVNAANVTNMRNMFYDCESLIIVNLFDTSNVTDMAAMFISCFSLASVPLFNTSNVTNMDGMFLNCFKVESGALALYQQASTQTTPPSNHSRTFYNCGRNTTTGAAELAQIPSDWK